MRLKENRTLPLTDDLRQALEEDWGVLGHYSEAQLRAAWEEHGERLLKETRGDYLRPWREPGWRPLAFWKFEAGRDEYVTENPVLADDLTSDEELGRALDAYDFEPILWLARHGHLRPDEIRELQHASRAARKRIGTGEERMEKPAISKDRSAVRLAEAVDAALNGHEPEPDYGVPYVEEASK